MFWFFDSEACGILVPQTEIEPACSVLEGKVVTPGPPGKSPIPLTFEYHQFDSKSKLIISVPLKVKIFHCIFMWNTLVF